MADPLDACTPLRNEFESNETDPIRFALIIRGDCSFEEKIRNAQSGGFSAVIVYDDRDGGHLVYSKLIFSIVFIQNYLFFLNRISEDDSVVD